MLSASISIDIYLTEIEVDYLYFGKDKYSPSSVDVKGVNTGFGADLDKFLMDNYYQEIVNKVIEQHEIE